MKILIVGMGLIGGSVCKALKNKTQHEVYGCDVDEAVLQQALQDHAIDGTGKMKDGIYDVCIVCLHHRIAQPCIKQALPFLKKGSILMDMAQQRMEEALGQHTILDLARKMYRKAPDTFVVEVQDWIAARKA